MKLWKQLFKTGPRLTRRAERIPLEMPLRFRLPEQAVWSEGSAMNISSSGVLFRADQSIKKHTPIQLSYVLPTTVVGNSSLPVHCKGEIVRTETPASPEDGTFLFAVKILGYDSSTPQ